MASLENHINRLLEKGECLTAVEITLRLDAELGSSNAYTISEVVRCADNMPNLVKSGKEYCRLPSKDTLAS
jgi:hypothetical protein